MGACHCQNAVKLAAQTSFCSPVPLSHSSPDGVCRESLELPLNPSLGPGEHLHSYPRREVGSSPLLSLPWV